MSKYWILRLTIDGWLASRSFPFVTLFFLRAPQIFDFRWKSLSWRRVGSYDPDIIQGAKPQKCQVHRRSGLVDIALRLRKSTASFRMHSMDSRCGVHMPNTPNEKTKSPETPEVKIVMKMEKETKTQLKVPEPHMWVSLWALCGFNEPANLSAIKDSL